MTNEQILTCAINIGEQLLINGAEISRVEDTISQICKGLTASARATFSPSPHVSLFPWKRQTGVDYPDQENIKLRHEYISWTDLIICPGKSVRNICPGRRSKRNSMQL